MAAAKWQRCADTAATPASPSPAPSSTAAALSSSNIGSVAVGTGPETEPTLLASEEDPPVDIDDNVAVGNKRKLKSHVWQEFEKITVGGQIKARCNWCKKCLIGHGRAGTNHLRGHPNSCESRQVRKGLKQSTLKLGKNKNGDGIIEKYVFDQQTARKELALMICAHEYPLSIVDHAGFRRFCATLQPLFKVVSRNTIKKDILDMYEVQRLLLVNSFQRCSSRIAVTTDIWTTNHQKKGYMAVTVHYINDDWQLKSFLLRFIYVPAPHTGEVISDILYEVLQDWQIEKKVSTVTLDNCSTNDNLMQAMQDKMPLSSLILHGTLMHMRCAAHIINLIVKYGMSVMEKGIERVRESVGFWSATPKRHERFERMVLQMNIKYGKRIALDCKTRWNSTYLMLSIALEYHTVFECQRKMIGSLLGSFVLG